MKKLAIQNPERRKANHYGRRIFLTGALGASSVFGLVKLGESASSQAGAAVTAVENSVKYNGTDISHVNLKDNPVKYVAKSGDTPWGIASMDPRVADDPQLLADEVQRINLQVGEDSELQPGEVIHLPEAYKKYAQPSE
ncbi:MAG TPA: hypothetical protein VMR34_01440 [Candidatus Saccharimonadales bacterium]|nr:hypothetical protein [Candidatus Saccharimonadales bacterium]